MSRAVVATDVEELACSEGGFGDEEAGFVAVFFGEDELNLFWAG